MVVDSVAGGLDEMETPYPYTRLQLNGVSVSIANEMWT